MARDQVEKGDREMAMQIDEARDLLWSAAHHWHFQGATESNLSFICCSCECTGMVEAGEHGYLRYSLLRGSQLIGSGRGFMTGDCPAGQRPIWTDGYDGCISRQEMGLELLAVAGA